MADFTSEVLIPGVMGDVVVKIRFLSQVEREALNDGATPRGALQPDRQKLSAATADAMILSWSNLHQLDALGWGYADADALLVDDRGFVPYHTETARKLYRSCQYDRFAQHLDQANRDMMEAIAREKKAALQRSAA